MFLIRNRESVYEEVEKPQLRSWNGKFELNNRYGWSWSLESVLNSSRSQLAVRSWSRSRSRTPLVTRVGIGSWGPMKPDDPATLFLGSVLYRK